MEHDLEYIEAWFNKTLSIDEAKIFEKRILEDKDFANEVAFYLAAKQSLKEQVARDKKELFRELWSQNRPAQPAKKDGRIRKMWVAAVAAAAVLVCAFFAWYLFLSGSASPQRMAENYISGNLKTLPVSMGDDEDGIQKGLRFYNESRYDSAISEFDDVLKRDTGNYLATEFLGITYLIRGEYDRSIRYFQQLENYSLYSNPGMFYHALALMKRNRPGDNDSAKELLQKVVDNKYEKFETARQWLKKW